jgi:hypothetical protein
MIERFVWLSALAFVGCVRLGYGGNGPAGDDEGDVVCPAQSCRTETFGDNTGDAHAGVTRDTTLESTTPTVNYGGRTFFQVSNVQTGLLRFDLSSIPVEAVIVRGRLSLTTGQNASDETFTLHQVLEDWTEGAGTSDGTTVAAANWQERVAATAWTSPGCDAPGSRQTDAVGTFTQAVQETRSVVDVHIDLIQAWVDGALPNFGLAMIATGPDAASIITHNGADGSRPSLELSYELP